jgi:hypothetical protein
MKEGPCAVRLLVTPIWIGLMCNDRELARSCNIIQCEHFCSTERSSDCFPGTLKRVPGNVHVLGSWRDEHSLSNYYVSSEMELGSVGVRRIPFGS